VIPPIQARPDGTYVLQLHEYDPGAYSDDTAVTDTVPSLGTGYASASPPVVAQLNTVYSTTEYNLVGMGKNGIYDGRVVLGDTGRNVVLGSNDIRLPNNVPIYGLKTGGTTVEMLKMDTSERLVIGDSNEIIYLNAASSGGVSLPDGVPLVAGWTYLTNKEIIKYISGSNKVVIGSIAASAPEYELNGRPVSIQSVGAIDISGGYPEFKGKTSYAGVPQLGSFATDSWGIHKNTSTGAVQLVFNDGGTLRMVTLA
jgi:hypothetical protein